MALITATITLVYEAKGDVDVAAQAVATNMEQLLKFAGIVEGKPRNPEDTWGGLPIFCPPPVARAVDLKEVKTLFVLGGFNGN